MYILSWLSFLQVWLVSVGMCRQLSTQKYTAVDGECYSTFTSVRSESLTQCAGLCSQRAVLPNCVGFNYNAGSMTCQLSDGSRSAGTCVDGSRTYTEV